MGSGIPLFSEVIQQTALELTSIKIYGNGVLLLHYKPHSALPTGTLRINDKAIELAETLFRELS